MGLPGSKAGVANSQPTSNLAVLQASSLCLTQLPPKLSPSKPPLSWGLPSTVSSVRSPLTEETKHTAHCPALNADANQEGLTNTRIGTYWPLQIIQMEHLYE